MAHQSKTFYQTWFFKRICCIIWFWCWYKLVIGWINPYCILRKKIQSVVSANTKPLQIDYKVSNVHICNKNIYFKTSLLLVKDINKEIILGIPFLALLYPFRVDEEGLKTVYKGQEICFKFISSLKMKELNILEDNEVNLIQKKKQHIKLISK